MKFREQITQPGLVIDLMTAVLILSVSIWAVLFFVVIPSHVLYHRGPDWHHVAKNTVRYLVCYLVSLGVAYLWKHRKSRRLRPKLT